MLQFISSREYERILRFDNEMLLIWANRITKHYWGVPFVCKIFFNGRFKRTYGMFRVVEYKRRNIIVKKEFSVEISKDLITNNETNRTVVEQILKHELCHWYIYTYVDPRRNKDGDPLFEHEIQKIGAISQRDINAKRIFIQNSNSSIKYKKARNKCRNRHFNPINPFH